MEELRVIIFEEASLHFIQSEYFYCREHRILVKKESKYFWHKNRYNLRLQWKLCVALICWDKHNICHNESKTYQTKLIRIKITKQNLSKQLSFSEIHCIPKGLIQASWTPTYNILSTLRFDRGFSNLAGKIVFTIAVSY